MFIDQVEIEVIAGKGGDGIIAFRREPMVELGGPFGGTGGNGGNVILEVDEGLRTLLDFSYNKKYKAVDGGKGQSKGKTGARGKDLILRVPPGTVIYNADTNEFLGDLVTHQDQYLLAKCGRGGRGNLQLAKAGRQSLEICENGEPGQTINVRLELKLLADVGLVGLPSVGKSTIISVISKVKPKIAAYHFTTKVPNLGVVKPADGLSYVVADLPGLIEGAHQGRGLGHQFLRHVERTRLILHVVDMGGVEYRNPIEDYKLINNELKEYKLNLLERPQIVVANKMDIDGAELNLQLFKEEFPEIDVIELSALTKSNTRYLIDHVGSVLEKLDDKVYVDDDLVKKIYKFVDDNEMDVFRDEHGEIRVEGPAIERIVAMTNFNTLDNVRRFANTLKGMGVYEEIEKLNVVPGEVVHVMEYAFEYE